jgi:hypothetical protein
VYKWEITTCSRIVTPLLYLGLDSFFYCPLNLLVTGTYRALAPHLGRVCTRVWTGCPATLPARCAFLFFILFLKNHLVLEELSYYAYLNPLLWNISETYSTAGLRLWVIEALQSTWSYGCYDPRVVVICYFSLLDIAYTKIFFELVITKDFNVPCSFKCLHIFHFYSRPFQYHVSAILEVWWTCPFCSLAILVWKLPMYTVLLLWNVQVTEIWCMLVVLELSTSAWFPYGERPYLPL